MPHQVTSSSHMSMQRHSSSHLHAGCHTVSPAATPLWNSGQAVTSAAAPGTALAADRSRLKTALCCCGRRPARHRSGMHNGSVGMGLSVPAQQKMHEICCSPFTSWAAIPGTGWSQRNVKLRTALTCWIKPIPVVCWQEQQARCLSQRVSIEGCIVLLWQAGSQT